MNQKLFLIIILLCISSINMAQDDGWPIQQRCLGDLPYPTIPQNQWTFEGVIFSRNQDGVRAIRTDIDTSYFVALDSGNSFALDGGFSPDGKWFAYPTGTTGWGNMTSELVSVRNIQIVSTGPARKIYEIPWRDISFAGVTRNLPVLYWLDNERFLYEGQVEGGGGTVNAFTGDYQPWTHEIPLIQLYSFSPDSTRALHWDRYGDMLTRLYDAANDRILEGFAYRFPGAAWLSDSSGFIANIVSADGARSDAVLFDRDGTDTIAIGTSITNVAFAPDGRRFVFVMWPNLYLGDIQEQVITDLCFTMSGMGQPAWSPDNIHVIFTYDGYPVILNTDTLEMQILRYKTGEILGWYALADE